MGIDRAASDLAMLEARAAELRAELDEVEAKASRIHTYIEMAQHYDISATAPPKSTPSFEAAIGTTKEFGGNFGKAIAAVASIIIDNGSPVHTRVLIDRLRERGIAIGGKEPVGNLSSALSRSGKFTNSRMHGWSLRSQIASSVSAKSVATHHETANDAAEHS